MIPVQQPRRVGGVLVLAVAGKGQGDRVLVGAAAVASGGGLGQRPAGRLGVVGLGADAHELVVEGGGHRLVREPFGLVLGVGDAALRQRVGEQELGRPIDEAEGAAHALEHASPSRPDRAPRRPAC